MNLQEEIAFTLRHLENIMGLIEEKNPEDGILWRTTSLSYECTLIREGEFRVRLEAKNKPGIGDFREEMEQGFYQNRFAIWSFLEGLVTYLQGWDSGDPLAISHKVTMCWESEIVTLNFTTEII